VPRGLLFGPDAVDQGSSSATGSPPKTRTPGIEAWRATLDDAKKRTLNDPGGAVWHAWRRTTTERPSQHRLKARSRIRAAGYGRAIHWPQTALKRAAEAIREARSGDCIVLARKALEAAIRNENDLLALLPDDLPATSTPQRQPKRMERSQRTLQRRRNPEHDTHGCVR
jgi:hypothetical protein